MSAETESGSAPEPNPDPKASEPQRGRWEQRLNEAGGRVEEELRRVVRYIDDEVVPEIRRNGSSALRYAAAELDRLAQSMDDHRGPGASGKS